MNTKLVNSAAGVINAALGQDRTAAGIALALESAQLLTSPETVAELEHLRKQRDAFRDQRNDVFATNERLLAEVRESDQARLLAENETRTVKRHVAALEAQRERRRVRLVALQNDALSMRGSLSPNGEDRKVPFSLGETLTPAVDWLIARVAELEAERQSTNESVDGATQALRERETAPLTVFRASHDSIVMGLYTTRQAAYEHCEAYELRDDAVSPMAWNVDEDGVAELVRLRIPRSPGADSATGYVVTPVEVASEYDEEADE